VRSRYLAAGAALWSAAYCCGYVAVIHAQGDGPVAWWYLGLVLFAAAALSAYALGAVHKVAPVVGFVILVGATLLGLLTIGVFLLPAVVAAGAAMSGDRPAAAPA
jgi:hypothetical protein